MTGRLGQVEHVAHRGGRDMGEIHQHAQAIHLPNHLAPEFGETVVAGGVQRRVGPVEGHVVGQRHVAGAQIVVGAQRAKGVLDGVAALHAEQGGDAAPFEAALDVFGGQRQRQAVGVTRHDAPGDVELLQLHLGKATVLDLTRDIDGPELGPHLALGQPGQIGVPFGCLPQVVVQHVPGSILALPDLPGQVVMSVDQGSGAQELLGPLQSLVLGLGGDARRHEEGEK